jgi:hypothetical protein
MKRIITILILTLVSFTVTSIFAQSFEIRITDSDEGYLAVQMRETTGTGTPTTTIPIVDISFEIRWLTSEATDVSIICSNNSYNLADGLGAKQTSGSYDFRIFQATNTPFYPPHDWTTGEWETLATFKATTGTGTADFEISPHQFGGYDLNWNQGDPPHDYLPVRNGSISNYGIPTLIYNYVWTGAAGGPPNQNNGYKWEKTANWEGTCSGDSPPEGSFPYFGQTGSYVLIPSGLSKYPEMTTGSDDWGWACKRMLIDNGAHVTVPDLSTSTSNPKLYIDGDLIISDGGKLNLTALGYATVTGSTDIKGATGIEVQATSAGVGSFIDNGTITYGASGTAKVQTFLANSAAVGSFYIHTVGPTVDVNGVGGALLSDFDLVALGTYAYKWDETVASTSGWVNVYDNNYLVATGDGIALSTSDATDHTIELTGALKTGSVSTPALTFSNNHLELISNPYPSAIDFQAFSLAAGNTSKINAKSWVWDPSAGNYKDWTYSGGSWTGSGSQYIQVGQAFFVQTVAAGAVSFNNTFRSHSNVAFRDANANELKMKVSGGNNGFSDELNIMFVDNATYGYDDFDTYKWNSMFEDATMIRSIANDGSELSVNFLPLDGLQGDMVSVPVHFNCGYTAEYTFDFEGIDSFEAQNEVWLEDLQDGDQWIILNGNPHYTFTANADDPADRFILHFFGPTGVDENTVDQVNIYSWGQYAYINNVTNEKIKKVSVYDISGHLVTEKRIPEGQKLSKIWVADNMAYYIVQVITEKNVYTNKVLINK